LARLPNVTYRLWPGLRHECLNEPERAEVLTELEAWLSARLGELSRAADR
jgi:alpha-beta hydrolase superfamily lysophospholipase